MYWTDTERNGFHRLIGGAKIVENLAVNHQHIADLAVDVAGGKLYWIEQTGDATGKIQRANLDGSNVELLKSLTSVPRDLAIDTIKGRLYLTNSWGKVQRLNFNSSNFQPNLITGLDSPDGIAVDMTGGKLYWTESGGITCADLNGENIQKVVTDLGVPADIVLASTLTNTAVASAPTALVALPEETTLLSNFPNPFNPETWIPYQLSKSAEVTLTIYDIDGQIVRQLALGCSTGCGVMVGLGVAGCLFILESADYSDSGLYGQFVF